MKNLITFRRVCVALIVIVPFQGQSIAWYNDPEVNTPVTNKPVSQIDHGAIEDGAGGAIVAWSEYVEGSSGEFDIYAQRIDSHGHPMWSPELPVCVAPGFQGLPRMVSDGAHGAIIVWHDSRTGQLYDFDIYAQRISPNGAVVWAADGVPVCTAPDWQTYADIAPDGRGGAFVAWDDGRNGNDDSKIYAQRLNANGQRLWPEDGILAAEADYGQTDADIIYDGIGGMVVVWSDFRQLGNIDVYAQKLDANGNRIWGTSGLGLATVDGDQFGVHVVSDGLGGALFSWTDGRLGEFSHDIYAQKVNAAGTKAWPDQGLPICMAQGSQVRNAIISDGAGGAIIAWEDGRKEADETDIYIQKVAADGSLAWNPDGMPVVTTSEVQIMPALLSDGQGGAFVTWQDFYREGTWWNIYAQHINGDGQARWRQDGIPVSIADGPQTDPLIVSDGSGGSIIIWYDGRSGTVFDIYAQQVDALGLLGGGEFRFVTANNLGVPTTTFAPGELVLFKITWTTPAPDEPGTYEAWCGMSINSGTDFQEGRITYDVSAE